MSRLKRHNIPDRICRPDPAVVVFEVQKPVAAVAHAQLFHIAQLTQAMAALHALYQVGMLMLLHGIYQIHRRLIHSQQVGGGQDADVGGDDRLGSTASQSQETDMLRNTLI